MPSTFQPGDRVRVVAECAGWLPRALLGTCATVLRVNGAGITVLTELQFGVFDTRYVPRQMAVVCLEVLPHG